MEKHTEKEAHYAFFSNRACEYFPCHEHADPDNFNCLFCYCPLYVLGDRCGGQFVWLKDGTKDCSKCLFPHRRENYSKVTGRYGEIKDLVAQSGLKTGSERSE